jgi:hypothetical protein
MDHEERERKFEQALERHLRRDTAGVRNDADARADVQGETDGTDTCPDAGTLAAFHEGLLLGDETNATTEHIAGCSRCQQIFLLLEATDEIPLQVEAERELQMREPVLSAGALYADYAARQTPSLTLAGEPKSVLKAPKDISRGRGFKALRWAAPAGAIAAGLLIWFVARDNKVQTLSHVDSVQVAQEQLRNEQLARPLPTAPSAESVTKSKRLNEPRKDNGRIKQPAEESDALRALKKSSSAAVANEVGAVTSNPNPHANTRQLPSESGDNASRTTAKGKSAEPLSRQADVSATAAAPPASPSDDVRTQSAAPTSEAAGTAAKQSANTTRAFETHTNGDVAQQVVTNDKLGLSRSLKRDGFENAKIILAPEGKVRWRLLSGGRIERSSNAGVTWLPQNSGVNVELIAGSAPSSAVCWIIGRGGTILRTTDGGEYWNKVVSPMGGDVTGVQAVGAMRATIFDANKIARYVTRDGGVTWETAKE